MIDVAIASPLARPGRAAVFSTVLRAVPIGLLPLAALLLIWQLSGDDDSLSFPPPSTWIHALKSMQHDGVLLPAIGETMKVYAVGLLAATVLGVLLGVLIGSFARVERALQPLMDFLRAVPPPAIVPVAALLLGVTLTMQAAIVVLAVIWPILLNTVASVREIPSVRLEMSRVLGLTLWERGYKVILPSLLPGIFVGLRISVSIALLVALLVDILGAGSGVGRLIVTQQQQFDAAAVWGLLLVIGLLGALLNLGLAVAEKRVLRGRPPGV